MEIGNLPKKSKTSFKKNEKWKTTSKKKWKTTSILRHLTTKTSKTNGFDTIEIDLVLDIVVQNTKSGFKVFKFLGFLKVFVTAQPQP
jgi:hypothetical protein